MKRDIYTSIINGEKYEFSSGKIVGKTARFIQANGEAVEVQIPDILTIKTARLE